MAIETSEGLTEAADETRLLMEATGEDLDSVMARQESLVAGDAEAWAKEYLAAYAEDKPVARLAIMGEVQFGEDQQKKSSMTFRLHPHQRGMLKAVAFALGREEAWVLRWMVTDRFLKMFGEDDTAFPKEWLADPAGMRERLEELERMAAAREANLPSVVGVRTSGTASAVETG